MFHMLKERKCHPYCCLGALQRLLCRSCLFWGGGSLIVISKPNLLIWGTPASCHFSRIFGHPSSKKAKNLAKKDIWEFGQRGYEGYPPIVGNMRRLAFYVWQKIWICCFKTSQNLQILPVTNIKAVLADFCKCHKCNRLKWFANYKCTQGLGMRQINYLRSTDFSSSRKKLMYNLFVKWPSIVAMTQSLIAIVIHNHFNSWFWSVPTGGDNAAAKISRALFERQANYFLFRCMCICALICEYLCEQSKTAAKLSSRAQFESGLDVEEERTIFSA